MEVNSGVEVNSGMGEKSVVGGLAVWRFGGYKKRLPEGNRFCVKRWVISD